MDIPKVTIVIPNWNLKSDLAECLDSIKAGDYPAMETCVVDNHSTDGSQEHVHSHYPWVHLIELKENLGYAGALNVAIRHSLRNGNPKYIFALNNDTIIPSTTLRTLVEVAESNPRIAICAPKILYYDDPTLTFSMGDRLFPFLPLPVSYGFHSKDSPKLNRIMDFDYVFGCALLIRVEVLKQIGLFDTSFFMYYEDADFCRRTRDQGWRIVRVGTAPLLHKASLSVKKVQPQMTYLRARNRSRFFRRYPHGPHRFLTWVSLFIGSIIRIFRFIFSNQLDNLKPYIQGFWHGLREPLPPLQDTDLNL